MAKRLEFDSLWKAKPFKYRVVKYFIENSDEVDDFYNSNYKPILKHFSNEIYRRLLDGTLTVSELKSKNFPTRLKRDKDIQDEYGYKEKGQISPLRAIAFHAVEPYKSYFSRNKKMPSKSIIPRNRSIRVKDSLLCKNDGLINIKDGQGLIPLKYFIPGTMGKYENKIESKSIDGWMFKRKSWVLARKATIYFKWRYQPENSLGFDINKTKESFMVFSKQLKCFSSDTLASDKNIARQAERLLNLNKEVKSKNIKSSQRRAVRKKVKATHNKMNKLITEIICLPLLEEVIENKFLLCVDPLSCGAKHGSFGQDKIVAQLTTLCENLAVPFVKVPTPYTTKQCSYCGGFNEKLTPKIRHWCCEFCKTEHIRDKNAAMNVEKNGYDIWKAGATEWSKDFEEKYGKNPVKRSKK